MLREAVTPPISTEQDIPSPLLIGTIIENRLDDPQFRTYFVRHYFGPGNETSTWNAKEIEEAYEMLLKEPYSLGAKKILFQGKDTVGPLDVFLPLGSITTKDFIRRIVATADITDHASFIQAHIPITRGESHNIQVLKSETTQYFRKTRSLIYPTQVLARAAAWYFAAESQEGISTPDPDLDVLAHYGIVTPTLSTDPETLTQLINSSFNI